MRSSGESALGSVSRQGFCFGDRLSLKCSWETHDGEQLFGKCADPASFRHLYFFTNKGAKLKC